MQKARTQSSDELDTDTDDEFNDPPNTMESLRYLGAMAGHKGWVTAVATSSENPDMILTASRGMCAPCLRAFANAVQGRIARADIVSVA